MLGWLCGVFARELKLPAGELDADRGFEDYGVNSILLADLVVALERDLKVKLEPGLLLEHRTLRSLAGHLGGMHGAPGAPAPIDAAVGVASTAARAPLRAAASEPSAERRVAVIGLACNFPGAPDAARFWRNLVAGIDAIREVPAERWDVGRHYQAAGGSGAASANGAGSSTTSRCLIRNILASRRRMRPISTRWCARCWKYRCKVCAMRGCGTAR